MTNPARGALSALKIVEFGGIGPAPFCTMLLSDLGADCVRIARPGERNTPADIVHRGRPQIELDLKSETDRERVKALLAQADVLIEGFRPGVMERLGLGPEDLCGAHPRLVYARMTGWGQTGPLAPRAGHDLNYASITGALYAIGDADRPPPPPLNFVADYGGGGLFLAVGILAALQERERSGQGQVVDAAMSDGASSLMAMFLGFQAAGAWTTTRQANLLDGAAPFYRTYRCADGKFLAVAPLEDRFFAEMLERLGEPAEAYANRHDPATWPALTERLAALFTQQPRDHWAALFEGSDACVSPVLDMNEAADYDHHQARGVFQVIDGVTHPSPAPRLSRTPGEIGLAPAATASDFETVLAAWSEG